MKRLLPLVLAALTVGCTGLGVDPQSTAPRFELLSQVAIPTLSPGGDGNGPVGGLSGLTYSPTRGAFYALSDDRARRGPARIYRLELRRLQSPDPIVDVFPPLLLTDPDGHPFAPGVLDPEGIAVADGFYVSSEGDPGLGIPPWVRQFDFEGRQLRNLTIPEHYMPSADGKRGVRDNRAFESLTLAPGGKLLFTAIEGPLRQDDEPPTLTRGATLRLLVLDAVSGAPLREHPYPLDPVHASSEPPGGLQDNGLVELLALSDSRLLALERSFAIGGGYRLRLYELDLAAADDILLLDSIGEDSAAVRKRLLLDLSSLDLTLDNFEGMTFGPDLPDGRRNLLLIADDNFRPDRQTSWLVSLAVDGL